MGKPAGVIRHELRARLGQIARELGRAISPNGRPRGTKVSELEDVAGNLGDEIARQLIETHIRGQAEERPDDELGEGPSGGGPARKAPDRPRVLTTTRGDLAWRERVANGPDWRRAFFPSGPIVGD